MSRSKNKQKRADGVPKPPKGPRQINPNSLVSAKECVQLIFNTLNQVIPGLLTSKEFREAVYGALTPVPAPEAEVPTVGTVEELAEQPIVEQRPAPTLADHERAMTVTANLDPEPTVERVPLVIVP